MTDAARRLFAQLVKDGTAPARVISAVDELIANGLAKRTEKGLELTLAGRFAANKKAAPC